MAFEVKCSDLSHGGCSWFARANVEDKLVDIVAVHMRDYHEIKDFTQEMIAEVKNKLSAISFVFSEEGDPVVKEYLCPQCDWRYIAQTENLIADAAAMHARDKHNIEEFTEEMITEVKNSLKPWSGA
jgi:predicted small metal-binding protein